MENSAGRGTAYNHRGTAYNHRGVAEADAAASASPAANAMPAKKGFLQGVSVWEALALVGIGVAIMYLAKKYI